MEFNREEILANYLENDAWLATPSFLFSQGRLALPEIVYIPRLDEKAYSGGITIDCSTLSDDSVKQLNGLYAERDDKRRGTIAVNEFRNVIQFQDKGKGYFGCSDIEDKHDLGVIQLVRKKRSKKEYEPRVSLHDLFGMSTQT